MDAHRAEFTCCPPGNAGYFLAVRVRYSYGMRCVLGFDGGGTKTDGVLMDETGAIRARARSGASNPVLVGSDCAVAALVEAAEKATAIAGVTFADVKIVSGGVAGMGAARSFPEVLSQLQAKFVNAHVSILSDLSMALAATGEIPSIVVVAGTGSAIFGRNGAGETAREAGLRAILGDPGSAYDIGRKAIVEEWRRTLSGEVSCFRNEILDHFHCGWQDLQEKIRAKPVNVLPQVFPLVARAANAGDAFARQLLRTSAEELAVLGARVITKLHLSGEEFLFAKTGGVFRRTTCFDAPFDECVRQAAPKARLGALPVCVAEFAARSAMGCLERPVRKAGS
jgi:glucosamine kinase